ncbi:protein RNA-directed DNA methylation 3 isoform X2 [Rhodamnia argentea]|uniref:Protein RNA-directed DNA methylation 3 isoform X2 n=1 Tax=Rhodamnia argentea TaxID=178133 RepID=A0ABM3HTP3_9MYRT|nr:protein RNA-directed DNA methylation 3 isoform X2 [Rhodamnia argentea]
MARKGKEVAGKGSSGKRKVDDDKTGGGRKRRNRGVLQFFEEAADEAGGGDASDDSIFDDEGFMEEVDAVQNLKNDAFKAPNLPVFPKEEQFEEEFDKILEARYRDGSALVRFADEYDAKDSIHGGSSMPSVKDPMVWKVKCTVGRERNSAFCLMQKYVDLKELGNKIQIISAFAIDHVKGYIYVEADRQSDVIESCRGLCSIYTSRIAPVPRNEVSHLLSVRSKRSEVSVGMWARVKNGKYKGDVAQVVAVNDERRRATVKLIPRIDLQAMAEKFGGGVSIKRTAVPAPRLISSSELEEFRPIIEYRRDRDTGKHFEVLDGLMLNDGYLYKRMSFEALSFWSVMPSEEELLKFQPSENNESGDVEWLSQLYGDKKRKRTVERDKGGEKGDGSASSNSAKKYELYELVSCGRKDFGLIVGFDKDDSYKILQEGSEGNEILNVGVHDIKFGPFEGKFTAFDQHKNAISVNDSVRVLEGPSKDKEGIVKQIYRGIVFLYNENEEENGGYTCCKAQCCEKIKAPVNARSEKGAESGFFGFDDSPSSPKSPLSPKKSWQARESNEFTRGDKEGPFSVGQTLRIRVGPLKGYLCRVIAIRRSDITVKLDSQQKVLTVKSEHLAELRGRSTAISNGVEPDSSTSKPFDLFGSEGCSTDWIGGAGASAGGDGWNAGGSSATGSSWPSFSASGFSVPTEHNSADPSSSAGFDSKKEDNGWERKVAPEQHSTWGKAASDNNVASNNDQIVGWEKGDDMWNKASTKGSFGGSSSGGWGKGAQQTGDAAESSKNDAGNWGKATLGAGNENDRDVANKSAWKDSDESRARGKEDNAVGWDEGGWNKPNASSTGGGSSWNNWNNRDASSSLGKAEDPSKDSQSWGGANLETKSRLDSSSDAAAFGEENKDSSDSWGKQAGGSRKRTDGNSWNATGEGSSLQRDEGVSSWKKQDGVSSWSKLDGGNEKDGSSTWGKQTDSSWDKTSKGLSWTESQGESKRDGGSWERESKNSSWGVQDGGSSLDRLADECKQLGGSSWTKDLGISCNKAEVVSSWSKQADAHKEDGGSWGKGDGSSSWGKQTGGSSWNNQGSEDRSDRWSTPQTVGGDQGRRDWGKEKKDDSNNQDSWERQKTFDGGRGSGGRRGRGGQRGGGRFGRGRSYGQDSSCGWKNEGDGAESWVKEKGSGRGWGSSEGSWGKGKLDSSGIGGQGGYESRNQRGSWNKPKSFGADGESWNRQDEGSSWSKPVRGSWNDAGGNSGDLDPKADFASSWGNNKSSKGDWAKPKDSWEKEKGDSGTGGWSKDKFGGNDQTDSWNKPKISSRGSSWNKQGEHFSGSEQAGDTSRAGDDKWDDKTGNLNKSSPSATPWGKNKFTSDAESSRKNSEESCDTGNADSGADALNKGGSTGQEMDQWSNPKASDAAGGSWNKSGGSWNKQDKDSSCGKQDGGSSWSGLRSGKDVDGCKRTDYSVGGEGSGNKGWSGNKYDSDGGSWNKNGGSFGKESGESGWGKQGGVSSWAGQGSGNNGDGWKKAENSGGEGYGGWKKGWSGNKDDPGGGSWNKDGGSWKKESGDSSRGKQGGQSSWAGKESGNNGDGWKKTGSYGGEGSGGWNKSWSGKRDDADGGSWNKNGGSSNKESGDSSWGKQGGGSSWAGQGSGSNGDGWKKTGNCGGEGSGGWNKSWSGKRDDGDGGSWNKNGGSSNKESGDSSWGKQGGASSWAGQGSGSNGDGWKKTGSSGGEGSGGWNKSWSGKKDDGDGGSWNKNGGSSNKESGDSSWGKQGGGSSRAGQGSDTSGDGWKKTGSSGGGEGSGGWKKGW